MCIYIGILYRLMHDTHTHITYITVYIYISNLHIFFVYEPNIGNCKKLFTIFMQKRDFFIKHF